MIGVGGGGCNAVARMVAEGLEGVEFYAMNTDVQALTACQVPNKLQLGAKITKGLGAGSNPEIGRQAALENTDHIVEIAAGRGHGLRHRGSGRRHGHRRGAGDRLARQGTGRADRRGGHQAVRLRRPAPHAPGRRGPRPCWRRTVDTVIAIPNDRLLALVPRGTSFFEAFKVADDLLRQAVQGISDIIITPGLINRDFSDIKATMVGMGYAMMGTAIGRGEKAAVEAARQAISCPLLEDSRISGSRGILINITGSSRLGLHEVNEACSIIREAADCDDVQINFGVILNESLADAVKITVIATGFQPENAPIPERRGSVIPVIKVQQRPPDPAPLPDLSYTAAPPEPEPVHIPVAEPEPVLDLDDLDTPAYLRQGTLLN